MPVPCAYLDVRLHNDFFSLNVMNNGGADGGLSLHGVHLGVQSPSEIENMLVRPLDLKFSHFFGLPCNAVMTSSTTRVATFQGSIMKALQA
jgi:hypothetical protein